MNERSGILAGGNWVVDKLKLIDTYPQQDALANILSESIGNGGSPFNILINLANLGADFPLAGVGLIGADADGEWITAQCAQNHISPAQLRTHPTAHTSYTDVMTVQSTARRTFFHQRGANAFLDDGHFDFESDTARIFHLGYLLLLDRLDQPDATYGTVAARVLQRAKSAGCWTSIDLVSEDSDRFKKVVLPALPYADYCFLNEFEIERTTGVVVRQKQGVNLVALQNAAELLIRAGVREWVVVHFPEGACALGRDGHMRIQGGLGIPQSRIVGTVGAGDAFAAGVLYGLHEGCSIECALHYGVCVATSCLGGAGASDGIRRLEKCLELENEFGVRAVP
jgi:sugar/nucleoside kinase (ribokinase family)